MSIPREIDRLRRMSVPELAARYRELFGKPPRVRHKQYLWKRCAWKLQEQRFGGLSQVAKRRLDELISEIDLPLGEERRTKEKTVSPTTRRSPDGPSPGTVITKRWRDRDLRLIVTEEGFEVDGILYRSLSAAAKGVTGTKWNGRLFWLGKSKGDRR